LERAIGTQSEDICGLKDGDRKSRYGRSSNGKEERVYRRHAEARSEVADIDWEHDGYYLEIYVSCC